MSPFAEWLLIARHSVVQVRSIGKRDCSSLFKLGDEMIAFNALHQLLASSVADMLPVNVSVLLCDEAKRLARQGNPRLSSAEASPSRQASMEPSQPGSKSFEGLMSSPWKVLPPAVSTTVSLQYNPLFLNHSAVPGSWTTVLTEMWRCVQNCNTAVRLIHCTGPSQRHCVDCWWLALYIEVNAADP